MNNPEIQEAFERVREALLRGRNTGCRCPGYLPTKCPSCNFFNERIESLSRLQAAFATQQTALDLMAKDLLAAQEREEKSLDELIDTKRINGEIGLDLVKCQNRLVEIEKKNDA